MVNTERMQRVTVRLADTTCSIASFILAYSSLPWSKHCLDQILSHHLLVAAALSLARTDDRLPQWQDLLWIPVVVTLALAVTLEYCNDPGPLHEKKTREIVFLQIVAMAVCVAVVATVFYALHVPPYSRLFVFSYIGLLFITTTAYRLTMKGLYGAWRDKNVATRRIVIAGRPQGIAKFMAGTASVLPYQILGCLLTTGNWSEAELPSIPVLGGMAILGDLLIHQPVDEVIMVVPPDDAGWVSPAIVQCDYFRVSVNIVHEAFMDVALRDLRLPYAPHLVPSVSLIPEEEFASYTLVWKRITDVIVSAGALILLAPLMLAIAIAIKLTTPGLPVFYRWNVVGYRGRRFTGYKFTTMIADADERKKSLAALNEMSGPVFKIRNDPRVTPLGRFLRKYSLNELPQLWSVLRGDMSLVGPRPAGPHELVGYELWQKRKLSVRPGITCFWQVRGRNAISNFDDWVKMDLEYIQQRSTWTDLRILFRTVWVVVRGTGS